MDCSMLAGMPMAAKVRVLLPSWPTKQTCGALQTTPVSLHRGQLSPHHHSSGRAVTAAAASEVAFSPNPDAHSSGIASPVPPHAPTLPVRPARPQRHAHTQPIDPDTARQGSAVAADTTGVAGDRAATAVGPEVARWEREREPSNREQHHRRAQADKEDNLRLAVLGAPNMGAWLGVVRQFATAVEASASAPAWKGMRHSEAHFAADALFRAAQLLREEGRSGDQSRASSSSGPAPSDSGSGVQGPAFRAALEMLLGHVAQCTADDLYDRDAFRCCRTLWALGKLAGDAGSEVGAEPAVSQQQEEEGKNQPHQHLSHSVMMGQGRLVASALAWKLADLAEATQHQQRFEHAAHPSAAAAAAAGGAAAAAVPGAEAGKGGDGPGRGQVKEYDTLCAPWLLAMAMWGLARLRNQGYACTDRPDPACLAPLASPTDATPLPAIATPPAPLPARPPRGPEAALWEALTGVVVRPAVLSALSCRELSNVLWALATARHSPNLLAMGALLDAMTARLSAAAAAAAGGPSTRGPFSGAHVAAGAEKGAGVNGQDVSNAVWALARLRVEAEGLQRLLRAAEGCVLRLLPALRPMHVASLLWSFSTLRYVSHAVPMELEVPTEGEEAAAAFAASKGPGGEGGRRAVRQGLYGALAARAAEMRLAQHRDLGLVSQLVWALVRQGLAGPGLLEAAAGSLAAGAHRLTLREAAMVASAYADARYMHQGLFGALLQRAGMEVLRDEAQGGGGGSSGQHKPSTGAGAAPGPLSVASLRSHPNPQPGEDVTLALLLRGLAWAHCYDEAVYSGLCARLAAHLPTIGPQPLAVSLWALARVRHVADPWVTDRMALLATALVNRFRAGELCTVALALATLGVRSPEFFDAAAVALTTRHGVVSMGGARGAVVAAAGQEVPVVLGGVEGVEARGNGKRVRGKGSGGEEDELVSVHGMQPGEGVGEEGEEQEEEEDEQGEWGEEEVETEEEEEEQLWGEAGLEEAEQQLREVRQQVHGGHPQQAVGALATPTAAAMPIASGPESNQQQQHDQQQQRKASRGGRRYWLQRVLHPTRPDVTHGRGWTLAGTLNPQELANLVTAYVRAGHVDENLFHKVEVRTRRLLKASELLRREAAAAAATAGGAGGGRAAAAAAALSRGDPVHAIDLSGPAAVKLLHGFVAAGMSPEDSPLLGELAARVRQLLPRLEPRDVAALAWALATCGLGRRGGECADLMARAAQGAARHAGAFAPADLATLAAATASVGYAECPQLLQACERAVEVAWEGEGRGGRRGAGSRGGKGSRRGREGLRLQVLSDVAWAHAALRVHRPAMTRRVAWMAAGELEAWAAAGGRQQQGLGGQAQVQEPQQGKRAQRKQQQQQGRKGDSTRGSSTEAAVQQQPGAVGPMDLDSVLQYGVALLEAYGTWGPQSLAAGGEAGGVQGQGRQEDGEGRAALEALLVPLCGVLAANANELSGEQVVSATWGASMLLWSLGPGAATTTTGNNFTPTTPTPTTSSSTSRAQQQLVLLLRSLSKCVASIREDSFPRQELEMLAQAHAACSDWAAVRAAAAGRGSGVDGAAAAAGAATPGPTRRKPVGDGGEAVAVAEAEAAGSPLRLPLRLRERVAGAWGAQARLTMRRAAVELCAALSGEWGFTEVRPGARSAGGETRGASSSSSNNNMEMGFEVPIDVAAVGHRGRGGNVPYGQGPGVAGTEVAVPGAREGERYAFLFAMPDQYATGAGGRGVLCAPTAVRAAVLRRRGWRVVVVPLPAAVGEAEGQGRGRGAQPLAWQTRDYVRAALREAFGEP